MKYKILAFYKFVKIINCRELQYNIQNLGETLNLRGSILIAPEGINATIAGLSGSIDRLKECLVLDSRFSDMQWKESFNENPPFKRWKVKVKPEILTFGVPEVDPQQRVGIYVSPKDWNCLIQRQDILVIDARNIYEISLGTFPGSINPQTKYFSDFKKYVHTNLLRQRTQKIGMFCTGGIRCEKASSYLLSLGFKEVYQLEGGVLKYLEEIDPNESLWEGACFVFDDRVSVIHGLIRGAHRLCGCGIPISINSNHCMACKDFVIRDTINRHNQI